MKPSKTIDHAIFALINRRSAGKTVCPSEVARALTDDGWRDLMSSVIDAAWRLEATGMVVISQHGHPVSRVNARGPIRIGLPRGVGKT